MDKQQLLSYIATALQQGVITPDDLASIIPATPTTPASVAITGATATPAQQPLQGTPQPQPESITEKNIKLSPVSLLYYAAGIILFAAMMTLLGQIWDDTNFFVHLLFTLGAGIALWAIAYFLGRKTTANDAQKGFVDTLMLTGSLSVLASTVAIMSEIGEGASSISAGLTFSVTLAAIAVLHLFYDRIVHHFVPITAGTLVLVASILPVSFTVASEVSAPPDAYAIILFATAAFLFTAGVYASRSGANRMIMRASYATLAVFMVLATIFVMTFASTISSVLWQLMLVLAIYTVFYLSIKRRSKEYLASGTLFLIIGCISISFRYFSGAGAAVSLAIAAASILASAFIANSINNKYIKIV